MEQSLAGSDLFQDYKMGTWGHLWSLGVEEQFYLLLPLRLGVMVRRRPHDPFSRLPWVCGFVAVACLTMRAVYYYKVVPFDHYSHMRPFHLRCDSLFLGVLLSYFIEFRPEAIEKLFYGKGRILLIASILCVMPAFVFEPQSAFIYIPGLTVCTFGIFRLLVHTDRVAGPPALGSEHGIWNIYGNKFGDGYGDGSPS